ncbi:FtsX-like permease family protein [Anaerocolumna sp. MB42-C2]|uniref:FtsX-like permease family protein n=1 Tax=Anaerocolumna sp. MB42-C2 TaxID=3070997 RepID=UPI0027E0E708|nr:FtsX-like permease family protein [Anaerocolumna sp. MB42-C2]WMJ88096.1 FtsX-like permease family protein [Anaerocolumna sp. MB42-C2]
MKKNVLIQDFKVEIKRSITRYLSILLIVALGVAFFSGIRASQPDMKLSADQYYDDTNLMDIRVLSTMGLTSEDVKAIKNVKGVLVAEPSLSMDVLCDTSDTEMVVKLMSLTKIINKIYITKGRLPEKPTECLVDLKFLEDSGYKIGDSIRFRSGTDEVLNQSLKYNDFKIVGVGNTALYLSFERGNSSIGYGKINSFIIIPSEAFKLDVFTEIYTTVNGAAELTSYTDAYDAAIEETVNQIKEIEAVRTKARYEEILSESQKEIAESKAKLRKQEENTNKKLAEAAKKLEKGKREVAAGEEKLIDGKKTLEKGKAKLTNSKRKLHDFEAELQAGEKKLNSSQAELTAGKKILVDKQKEYQTGVALLAAGYEQWNESNSIWYKNKEELERNKVIVKEALVNLYKQKSELEAFKDLYRDEWQKLLATEENLLTKQQDLNKGSETLEQSRKELDTVKRELDQEQNKLDTGKKELANEEKKIRAAEVVLADKKTEINLSAQKIKAGRSEIADAKTDIKKSEKLLLDKEAELKEAKATIENKDKEYRLATWTAEEKISDAKEQIEDAEQKLKDIPYPKWYVLNRNSLQTYVEFGQDSERIGNIGKVFPVIFFLVAALVSLTTMTRMVEEQRTQIGTLKALGYSNISVAGKYILYSLSASMTGSIMGVLIGEQILPQVIIKAYVILYKTLPKVITPYNLYHGIISALIAVFCTTFAAYFSCYKELMSSPAGLMRPAAPKSGKRVILERIPFLWKHLSFTTKATVRNLLRYKKRFFMTVFGIGGCMSLLLVGFGLKDSIGAMSDIQYVELWHQDVSLMTKDDAENSGAEKLLQQLGQDSRIKEAASVLDLAVNAGNGKLMKSVSLIVPKNTDSINDYIEFRNRKTHKSVPLTDGGVLITEKLADLLKISVGDNILIKENDTKSITVKVNGIVENYMLHYIFMTPELYERLYEKSPDYNKIYLKFKNKINLNEKLFASDILRNNVISSINFTSEFIKQINDMLKNLNLVVYVLIIAAGLLAFIVLYNLNNINISERKRELATLKVLGFKDMEVAAYVYRENSIITVIGALSGIIMGIGLHRLVILTTEIDSIMFGRQIKLISYLLSIMLTFLFSALVNYVMFYKLRKIDMVESLKSVE